MPACTEEIKIRNAKICKEWVEWHDSEMAAEEPVSALMKRVTEKYDLTQERIYQVLRENVATLKHNADWRKFLRICKLQREQAKKPNSKKDLLDLMEQERKELEGERPLVDFSQHHTIIIKRAVAEIPTGVSERIGNTTQAVSG
jgi:hypothetical protein